MDPEVADRLRRLQMEDLGSARREYISTADGRNDMRVRMEDIEASREVNIPGSDAHRRARVNQTQLADWANVGNTLDDTEDLEQLDSLLNGQSHRLNLRAAIRENRGQFNPQLPRAVVRLPGAALPRSSSLSLGRGGGVAGTRGRDTRHSSLKEGISKPGHRGAPAPAPPRRDPAADRSNYYTSHRDGNASKREESVRIQRGQMHTRKPTSRPQRPTRTFTPELCTPEVFMAFLRGKNDKKTMEATPVGDQTISDDDRSLIKQKPSVAVGAGERQTSSNEEVVPQAQAPKKDKNLTLTMQAPSQTDKSISELTPTQVQKKELPKSSLPMAIAPPELKLEEASVSMSEIGRSTAVKDATDVLVDFTLTPPQRPTATPIMSPSFEDLRGLEFRQDFDEARTRQPSPEVLLPYKMRRESSASLKTNTTSTVEHGSVPSVQSDLPKSPSVESVKRELDMVCQLIESFSLSEDRREVLRSCKIELEEKLRKIKKLTAETQGKWESQTQVVRTQSEEGSKAVLQDTPKQKADTYITQAIEGPGSQSRLNVEAPPFFPQTHRSPAESISSDSTPMQTPSRRPSQSCLPDPQEKHIFGDHLLPGRPSNPPERHIFGDHLLPGRRKDIAEPGTGVPETKQPPPKEPSETHVKFSMPRNSSVVVTKAVCKEFGESDTAEMEANPVAAENRRTASMPAPPSVLQQSIHAPKPRVSQPSSGKPSGSLGGLESSRYATPSSGKPLR
ncbi:hypothetical protein BO70DRAFT_428265 [Aspergillus heteromorphus CBS 117.55]|uniref:Uncharacterized protein n=1 Tax=Aspergillus heteromorphus CBS 117.55 TaxID=1448321 RepID=A0A317WJI3_9EURO|nr:uncharacterized protein BO70DRAFT_428265 [Aspergillus heteromorphus CBS 117.55]PWY86215.1 hypothetical protein BO70DRAFT_428265 [Aspergillus heteromorphus CBS 117.55]